MSSPMSAGCAKKLLGLSHSRRLGWFELAKLVLVRPSACFCLKWCRIFLKATFWTVLIFFLASKRPIHGFHRCSSLKNIPFKESQTQELKNLAWPMMIDLSTETSHHLGMLGRWFVENEGVFPRRWLARFLFLKHLPDDFIRLEFIHMANIFDFWFSRIAIAVSTTSVVYIW